MNLPAAGAQGFSTQGLAQIESLMQDYVDSGKSAGMLVLLSRGGEVAHLSCHGYADIASASPIREDSLFRIYSMTKPLTSVVLMTLMEQGQFDLDDAVKRWIPALGNLEVYNEGPIESDITVRQLLTHTAGFSYGMHPQDIPVDKFYADIWRSGIQEKTLEQILQSVFEFPLLAQPGMRWHYSVATDICGYLVERIADMPFADYLRKTILDPLGMSDTMFDVPADKIERLTTLYGYREDNPLAELETPVDSSFSSAASGIPVRLNSPGGGLVSTAGDYWRFAQMMQNRGELDGQRILQAQTVDLMTVNHINLDLLPINFNGVSAGPHMGYGFGLGYCVTIDTALTAASGSVGDFGWGGLADTYCWVDPEKRMVAILLQQFMPSLHHASRKDFRNAVYRALT